MAIEVYTPDENRIVHTTSVDFNLRPSIFKPVHLVQYDNQLPIIAVTLYNNGQPYVIPSDLSANIRLGKKDRKFVFNPALGCNQDRTMLYFEVTTQMVTDEGKLYPIVELASADKIAGSSPICVIVEKNPVQDDYIESSDEGKSIRQYAQDALDAAEAAAKSEQNAGNSATRAETAAQSASSSEQSASSSAENAGNSATRAETAAQSASSSEQNANSSAENADSYAKMSKSYAVGGTDTRLNEDTDNAHYYYEQSKRIVQGLSGALIPMGTVTFEQLALEEKQAGYLYNISNDFTTDSTFKEGSGHLYPAGTNVYYTADGFWDCLTGTQVISVNGQTGAVQITPAGIGAYTKEEVNARSGVTSVNGRTGAVTLTKADVGLDKVENTPDSSKNVASAARLGASKSIFGQSFDGTNNVAGQGTFHGTYASDPRYRYGSYGLLIREQDEVGNTQTDVGYAPGIGFNWNNRYAASLVLDYGKFHFYDIDGVSPAPVRCILDDPSMYRHVAFPIGSTDNQDEAIDDLIQDISKQNRQFSFVSWEDARGDTYFGSGTSLLLVHAPRYDLATILAMNYQHSGLVFCQYRFGVLHRYDVQKTQLS